MLREAEIASSNSLDWFGNIGCRISRIVSKILFFCWTIEYQALIHATWEGRDIPFLDLRLFLRFRRSGLLIEIWTILILAGRLFFTIKKFNFGHLKLIINLFWLLWRVFHNIFRKSIGSSAIQFLRLENWLVHSVFCRKNNLFTIFL